MPSVRRKSFLATVVPAGESGIALLLAGHQCQCFLEIAGPGGLYRSARHHLSGSATGRLDFNDDRQVTEHHLVILLLGQRQPTNHTPPLCIQLPMSQVSKRTT